MDSGDLIPRCDLLASPEQIAVGRRLNNFYSNNRVAGVPQKMPVEEVIVKHKLRIFIGRNLKIINARWKAGYNGKSTRHINEIVVIVCSGGDSDPIIPHRRFGRCRCRRYRRRINYRRGLPIDKPAILDREGWVWRIKQTALIIGGGPGGLFIFP